MVLWVRYERDGVAGFGTLEGESIQPHAGELFAGPSPSGAMLALGDVRLLAPVRPARFMSWRRSSVRRSLPSRCIS